MRENITFPIPSLPERSVSDSEYETACRYVADFARLKIGKSITFTQMLRHIDRIGIHLTTIVLAIGRPDTFKLGFHDPNPNRTQVELLDNGMVLFVDIANGKRIRLMPMAQNTSDLLALINVTLYEPEKNKSVLTKPEVVFILPRQMPISEFITINNYARLLEGIDYRYGTLAYKPQFYPQDVQGFAQLLQESMQLLSEKLPLLGEHRESPNLLA